MYRADYTGPEPPEHVVNAINTIGGFNTFGFPMYRLVWADARLSPVGGVFVDWPTGSEKKPLDKPLRRVVETRMMRRYPSAKNLWALEKWIPPWAYGSREQWHKHVEDGGTILVEHNKAIAGQGEYPYKGEYEYTGYGFTPDEVTEYVIASVVGAFERDNESLPKNPVNRARRMAWLAQNAINEQEKEFDRISNDILDDMQPAFGLNPFSTGGPKHRESVVEVCERLGIKSHPF